MLPNVRWLAVIALIALAVPVARAEDEDLTASVFTESGYEIRRDERLFTLYSLFNVAGYDRAEEPRAQPFPRRAFHPIRASLRDTLAPLSVKLRGPVDQYLDAHPQPIETYLAAALTLSDDADFRAKDALPAELSGLDKTLGEFSKATKLPKISAQFGGDFRAEFKRLRDAADGPFSKLRALYRLKEDDAPALALVPMPLEGPRQAYAFRVADGSHVVVFGLPATGAVDLGPALEAYGRVLAEAAVAEAKVDGLKEAVDQLKTSGVLGVSVTPASILAESLRIAVAAKLGSKEAAAEVEASPRKALFFARDFLKALDEPAEAFPADKGTFVSQVAARTDLKKALAEASGKAAESAIQKSPGGRK